MAKPSKLKPCPFCGGEAVLPVFHKTPSDTVVECLSCFSVGPRGLVINVNSDGQKEAAAAWNCRVEKKK